MQVCEQDGNCFRKLNLVKCAENIWKYVPEKELIPIYVQYFISSSLQPCERGSIVSPPENWGSDRLVNLLNSTWMVNY